MYSAKRNYQKELDTVLQKLPADKPPTLLLHACGAPCSSYVLLYLSEYFSITVFFYNPNISEEAEYQKRREELLRLIAAMPARYPVQWIDAPWEPGDFFAAAKGLENCPEGGERCFACYRLRLEKTARLAQEKHFDWFTTTLSISPLKNAAKLNAIGEELAQQYGVPHLPSDFKKRGGYLKSIELSRTYQLYRQNYCGCVFSKAESERRRRQEVLPRE